MKKAYSFLERGKSVSKDVKNMVEHSMATVKEIWRVMDKLGIDQRRLAEKLGKHESEISKWLSGTHNFTYSTVSKIEEALGEKIITTVSETATIMNFYSMSAQLQDTFTIRVKESIGKRNTFAEEKIVSFSITGDDEGNQIDLDPCFSN